MKKSIKSYLEYFGVSSVVVSMISDQALNSDHVALCLLLPIALKVGMKIVHKTTPIKSHNSFLRKK